MAKHDGYEPLGFARVNAADIIMSSLETALEMMPRRMEHHKRHGNEVTSGFALMGISPEEAVALLNLFDSIDEVPEMLCPLLTDLAHMAQYHVIFEHIGTSGDPDLN